MRDAVPPRDLTELYDDATLAALDAWGAGDRRAAPVPAGARGWRGGAAAGALLTGLVLGVRDVLEADTDDEPVLEVEVPGPDPGAAVVVHLVPFAAAASVAVVRPWLLAAR